MDRVKRILGGICILSGLLLSGCHHSDKTQLAFVTNNPSDYWRLCKYGVEKAQAQLPNVNVTFEETSDGTEAQQISNVSDLLVKGVKGIAISPVNPSDETPQLNQWASQAKLLTADSDAPGSNRLCYIGSDNHAAGLQVGEEVKKALPNGGQIMLFVGMADAQNAQQRISGVEDALKGSNITILGIRTDQTDPSRAISNVSDTITKYPNIAGLVGIWSYNGPAIVTALRTAGDIGKIKVVCFDQEAGTLQGLQSGAIYASVMQQPFVIGYDSIMLLNALTNGDASVHHVAGDLPYPTSIPASKTIYIPTQVVTPATVQAYIAQQTKLMGAAP